MGIDLTYRQIDTGKYELKLTLYRDCNGVVPSQTQFVATSIASKKTIPLGAQTQVSIRDITDIGANCATTSRCGGGNFPYGIEEYVYTDIVDLSKETDCEWEISWSQCCRNTSITTGPAGENFYEKIMLNKCVYNSSPTYTVPPVVFLNANENVIMSLGTVDTIDGYDSLSYHLVAPLVGDTIPVTFSGMFTFFRPLTFEGFPNVNAAYPGGFRIVPQTGDLLFKPVQANQIAVFAVEVREYRRINGSQTIIGKTRRDIQMIIIANSSALKTPHVTSYYQGLYSVCLGDSLVIPIQSADSNVTDSTFIFWNNGIPDASFIANNGTVKNASATFAWKPDSNDVREGSHSFTFEVRDNSCPIPRKIYRTVHVFVRDSLPAPYVTVGQDYGESQISIAIPVSSNVVNRENRIVLWRTEGDGYFLDSFANQTEYYPGPNDQKSCRYKLMRGIWDSDHCYDSSGKWSDTMEVYKIFPAANAGADQFIHPTDTVMLSSNWISSRHQTGIWSTTGDGVFSDSSMQNTSYYPGLNDLAGCGWNLVLTITHPSCATLYDTLTVQRIPGILSAGSDVLAFRGDTVFIDATKDTAYQQITRWRTLGDGVFGDTSSTQTWYLPGVNDYAACSAALIIEELPLNACFSNTDTLWFVKQIPNFNAGSNIQLFFGDTAHLSATPLASTTYQFGYWTSLGDGSFIDSNDAQTAYVPGSADWANCGTRLIWNEIDTNCGGRKDTLQILRVSSMVDAGQNQSAFYSSGMSFTLSGWSDTANAQQAYWTTNGDGSFNDTFDLNAIYTPGANDLLNCQVELSLYGYPAGTCAAVDVMTIAIQDSVFRILNLSLDSTQFDTIHIYHEGSSARGNLVWTSTGTGQFTTISAQHTIYVLSAADKTTNG
ncbi:MAG: hypothetical protein LPK45_03915, partial [Bacteroidota bacterium]|nr:hypothetical protein [Bacteroidota bacterium]MDX5468959.1 hypothetical protein [Bacteroidota bacterium]